MRRSAKPILLTTLAALLAAAAIPATRDAGLRAIGSALVVHDRLTPADVIVIASDADEAGLLEAADLVHEGIAPRVALFMAPQTPAELEFAKRGFPLPDWTRAAVRELGELGVGLVERIPGPVEGTNDEARDLPSWCRARQYRTIVFVSTSDHSRRTRRVLRRTMRGSPTRVILWYSRYSTFDPNAWWRTRGGTRTAIIEGEKLLLDVLRHPLD